MTQNTGPFHARWLGAIAASAIVFSGATIAAASDKTDAGAEDVQIIKIVRHHDGDGKYAKGTVHEHEITMIERCDGQKPQVDEAEETTDKDGKVRKSRVVICSKGGTMGTTQALEALERARASLADVTELSESTKARALASLDEQIARLRAEKYPLQ